MGHIDHGSCGHEIVSAVFSIRFGLCIHNLEERNQLKREIVLPRQLLTHTRFLENSMISEDDILPASTLATPVPSGLSAACFYRRPPSGRTIRLYAVGDIGFSGKIKITGKKKGFPALFGEIANLLRTGDVVFGNLETPLTNQVPEGSLFSGSLEGAVGMSESGFSIVHLANNHICDYGPYGIRSTLNALQENDILTFGACENRAGARQLVQTDVGSLRVGWLGCGRTQQDQTEGGPYFWEFEETEIVSAIRKARDTVDVLIVSIHIGYMYLDYPHPDHKDMANRLVAEGADLILMHHAHVLQGVEFTKGGGVICYNLGNFLWDWEEGNVRANVMVEEQRQGAVFLFDLDQKGVCGAAALPTCIDDACCVRWATGEMGISIIERLNRISLDLKADYADEFRRQRHERNTGLAIEVLWFHFRKGNWAIVIGMLKKIRSEHFRLLLGWLGGRGGASLRKLLLSLFTLLI